MFFSRCVFLTSQKRDLFTVGSRWRRLRARTTAAPATSSSPLSSSTSVTTPSSSSSPNSFPLDRHASTPCGPSSPLVTVIPLLHVASMTFYDTVMRYLDTSVQRYGSRACILLEGICDGEEDAELQRHEYAQIAHNTSLQEMLRKKAEENTVFTPAVQQEICTELGVDYSVLLQHQSRVRLQECYLKPKMAVSCGLYLHNEADLTMKEVQAVLRAELEEETAKGSTAIPTTISVRHIGQFPRVRQAREEKVARAALERCRGWLANAEDGEVIIPWGFFHAEPIVRLLRMWGAANGTTSPSSLPLSALSSQRMAGSAPTVEGHAVMHTRPITDGKPSNDTNYADGSSHWQASPFLSSGGEEGESLLGVRSVPVYFEEDREWTRSVPFGLPEAVLCSKPTDE